MCLYVGRRGAVEVATGGIWTAYLLLLQELEQWDHQVSVQVLADNVCQVVFRHDDVYYVRACVRVCVQGSYRGGGGSGGRKLCCEGLSQRIK